MKKPTLRRIFAFIIDIVIVSIIAGALSNIKFINPALDSYEEATNTYMEYINNSLTTQDAVNMLNSEEYKTITLNLNITGRYSTLITLVVSFLYFVVFQYFTKGYTGGKKLLKIKVEPVKGKLKFYQLLLRSLIVNNLFTTTLTVLLLFIIPSKFITFSTYVELLEMGLLFVTFGMILYRQDGRGLHDMLAGTKVVNDIVKE